MKAIKNKFFLSGVLALIIYIVSAYNLFLNNTTLDISFTEKKVLTVKETTNSFLIPYSNNDFFHFKEALAFKESRGIYTVVNKYGYLGKYQFGSSTLKRFKIYNTNAFLQNPQLQEQAFVALCQVNKWILRKDIGRSVGKKINGIVITESGILAAAHLAGAGNVKKFLRSKGTKSTSDAFGTSIENYMYTFGGYDTSNIKKDRMPTVG
tara:strand:+ start:39522 stop:40145 length:624 start_codon:yes stop_codon:yes gene_type:complete